MNLIDFVKMQVQAHPLSMEAYRMAKSGNIDGLVGLYARDEDSWPKPEPPVACAKGCSLCCSLNVEIMSYEKQSIRRAINSLDRDVRQSVIDKALSKHTETKDLNVEERYHKRIPCALLDGNDCYIYDDRPLSCRAFHSVDLNICIEGSKEGSDVESREWQQPKEAKEQIELGIGLYELENGKGIDNIAMTLERFITESTSI